MFCEEISIWADDFCEHFTTLKEFVWDDSCYKNDKQNWFFDKFCLLDKLYVKNWG